MEIISKIKSFFNKEEKTDDPIMDFITGKDVKVYSKLSDPTYYTCLKLLSETVGKLTIHLYNGNNEKVQNHKALELLNVRPNIYHTPSTFKQILEINRNHNGNAYCYIDYDSKGELKALIPLKSEFIRIIVNDTDSEIIPAYIYEYTNSSKTFYFKPYEILHLKGGIVQNGLYGASISEILKSTFELNKSSEKVLDHMYDTNLTGKVLLTVSNNLAGDKRQKMQEIIEKQLRNAKDKTFLTLPNDVSATVINSNLSNSQFLEIRKYTSNQIASVFGISPTYINDYTKSSYSSAEMQTLSFYVDTLLAILKQYEEEMNYKLLTEKERKKGYNFKFNVASILRGDLKTQAEALRTYVSSGIYTVNEARVLSGMPTLESGDVNLINGTYVELKDIGKAYNMKGGD